jgi:hypothetical protein
LAFGETEIADKIFQYFLAMISSFEHNPVNAVFVEFKDSRCPANAVTFANGQNNPLDGFPAVVGMHKNGVAILRKPLITGFTTKQMGLILAIARAGGNIALPPDPIICTAWIRAEVGRKIYHHGLLPSNVFIILS